MSSATINQLIHQFSLLLMAQAVLGCLLIGSLFFFKKSGQTWANRCFGFLLLFAGLTQLHYCFDYGGYLADRPELGFYPIYFNLWLPVLIFYYIKLTLYPTYRLQSSDIKHFLLPLGQLLYFWMMWLNPSWRHPDGRWFYSPFYGGLEQALFLFMVPVYLIFSYQYFRRSKARSQSEGFSNATKSPAEVLERTKGDTTKPDANLSAGHPRMNNSVGLPSPLTNAPSHSQIRPAFNRLSRTHWYIYQLMRGTFLFWLAYAAIALADFFAFKFWGKDLREQAWFAACGALSFSGLLYGWCLYGFQVLVWGRNLRIGRRFKRK